MAELEDDLAEAERPAVLPVPAWARKRQPPAPLIDTAPPAAQSSEFAGPPDDNVYAKFVRDDPGDGVDLYERARLNALDAHYRGTLAGSGRLAALSYLVKTPDPPDTPPEMKKLRDTQRNEYQSIIADLARYDAIKPWSTAAEAGVALGGQVGGSLTSPEAFLGVAARGATALGRTVKAAAQNATIMGAVDPLVQGLAIKGGAEKEFSFTRWLASVGLGGLIGGGLHGFGELVGQATTRRKMAQLADDDPSLDAAWMTEERRAAPTEPPPAGPTAPAAATAEHATPQPDPVELPMIADGPKAPPIRQRDPGLAPLSPENEALLTRREAPSSPDIAFEEWFAGSKVIDEAGRPIPVFHGTSLPQGGLSFDRFDPALLGSSTEANSARSAIFLSEDLKVAKGYAETVVDEGKEGRVATAYLNVKNPLVVDFEGRAPAEGELARVIEKAKAEGHDAVQFKNVVDAGHVADDAGHVPTNNWAVFDPDAVRIAGFGYDTSASAIAPPRRVTPSQQDELALAARQGGGTLRMERQRPDTGIATPATQQTGTAVLNVPNAPPSNRPPEAIRSLQQQAFDLADALDFPLREGRIRGGEAVLGTYNVKTGVVRNREIADFEVTAHEAGHALEVKIGPDLTNLTNRYAAELAPLVSAPGAYDPAVHVKEGFAEWVRRYIGNPQWAEQVAPTWTQAFREFMFVNAPEQLAALDKASAAYRAYLDAPSVDAVHAVVRSRDEDPDGFRGVVKAVEDDGFPAVITKVIEKSYDAVLDQFAPVARAVREGAKLIRDKEGKPVDLKAADNPETHLRLLGRTQQAAVLDMMDGVRPYHQVTPEGPGLRAALAKATGDFAAWGKWDPEVKSLFSDYLVARRAEYLWNEFKAGELPNPPAAFSQADAKVAMADLEAANPTFREASDMVHQYTRQLLRKQFEGGLISRDVYDKLLQQDFYVPFYRDLSDKPLAGGDSAMRGVGDRTPDTVQRMRGSTRDIKDPIESLMLQTFLVNRALRHNDMIKSFVDYFGRAGPEGGRYVEPLPAQQARNYTFDLKDAVERAAKERGVDPVDTHVLLSGITDFFGEDPIMGSFFKMEPVGKRGEPIVFYKEAGEMRAARFMAGEEGHALYELVTTLPQGLADVAKQVMATSAGVLRSGIVTNPVFMVTNYIRDQMAAGILRTDFVPFVSGVKGMYAELAQTELAALYGYAGAISPGAKFAPLEQAVSLNPQSLKASGYLSHRLQSLHGLLELASVTEAGTRNSIFETVYKQKRSQGLSEYESMMEAAFQAQDFLDFGRHGSKTMWIVAATPFFNATMQGLDKARRVLFEPIVRRMKDGVVMESDVPALKNAIATWTKMAGVGGALGAAWAAVHQGDNIYQDASPEVMGTHFVTSIGGKMVVVPKPFELAMGFTAGEYAYKKMAKDDPRAAEQFAKSAWEVLHPPTPIFDNPLIKTTTELATGKSFYPSFWNPREMVPDTLKRLPAEMQYTDRTSPAAKAIANVIGVSPIKVEYAIGGYFGLWGRDMLALSQGLDDTRPEANWADTALVRRFIKDPTRSSDATHKFWDFMGATTGKYNQAVAAHSELISRRSPESDAVARDFLNNLPENQRAYVIMRNAADDDGKQAFKVEHRRLHPLQRSYDAVTVLNGVRREMDKNSFAPFETSERLALNNQVRGQIRDAVRELAQVEMYNGLILTKEPGYATRPLFDAAPVMEKIRKLSPEVADEIATRYATARIYKIDSVAKAYPKLVSEVLRNGSQADLGDLSADALAEGFEFGADRVKRPPRRRVPVQPRQ